MRNSKAVSIKPKDARKRFEALNKVFGLFNNQNDRYEAVGFDKAGNLSRFTDVCATRVSLAQSVEIVHRLELEFCTNDKPLDTDQTDEARHKWFAMLEKELNRLNPIRRFTGDKPSTRATPLRAERQRAAVVAINAVVTEKVREMQYLTSAGTAHTEYELMQSKEDGRLFVVTHSTGQPSCIRPMSTKEAAQWVLREIVPNALQQSFKVV